MYNHIHEFSKLILRFFNKNCDENSSSLRNSFRVQSSTDTTLCFMSLLCILPKARCYLHMITARVGMYILVNHLYTHLQRVGVGYFKQLKKSARDALRSAKKLCSFLAKNIADELDELINTGCYSFGILTFGHDIHILIIGVFLLSNGEFWVRYLPCRYCRVTCFCLYSFPNEISLQETYDFSLYKTYKNL